MNFQVQSGVYPTMITPYKKSGEVDYETVEKLVEWYWEEGCDGIFAACQSSEIMFLTLDERVKPRENEIDRRDEFARQQDEGKKRGGGVDHIAPFFGKLNDGEHQNCRCEHRKCEIGDLGERGEG